MVELLSPGVYIQERDLGPQPIEGVSTTTAGFVGAAERGLVAGPPTLVTSFEMFQRKYGGFVSGMTLAYAVRGFFENGGRRAYISRVVGDAAEESDGTFSGEGFNVRILAVSGSTLTLSSVVGLEVGVDALTIHNIAAGTSVAVQVDSVNSFTGVVTVIGAFTAAPGTHYATIPGDDMVNADVTFTARDPGAFGDRVAVLVDATYGNRTAIVGKLSDTSWNLASTTGLSVGARVQFESPTGNPRATAVIQAVNPATNNIVIGTAIPTLFTSGNVLLINWRVTVQFDGAVVETFDGLPTNSAAAFMDAVNERSEWVRLTASTLDAGPARLFPHFVNGQAELLAGGTDVAPTDDNVIGTETPTRSGLKALEAQQGISLIAAPGFTHVSVVNELIGQAERLMDRFAVFEASEDAADVGEVLMERGNYNSRYAAMYHPWVRVPDPVTGVTRLLAPTGHVLGAFARTDIERGVFKAPANVVLRGITGFASVVTGGEQDILNPAGVNVLRNLDGLGNVIWGARTISAEGLWKYVSVRRLFVFLEQSIVKGTRFAVFEPNDLRLWARLRDALVNFLTTQWRAGALFGARPEEAFFVRVDETTTTQEDRDNGRVNIIIGIAPVKPAEFIVIQIGQAPSSVIIAEQA